MGDQPQLQMIYPIDQQSHPATLHLPAGYALRTYQPGDEPQFYEVMKMAGFGDWDDEKLSPWLRKILPDGWFLIVHQPANRIVATTMVLHNPRDLHPFGGEMGWVAADPSHSGKGLGMAVCAAATARLVQGGYRSIYLLTDDFRLPALKIYLKLGWIPFLFEEGMPGRWEQVCSQLQWPFTPAAWQQARSFSVQF